MPAGFDRAADLGQVQAHRRGVADGHDQSRAQRQVMAFFRPMRAFRRRTGFLPRRDRCLARARCPPAWPGILFERQRTTPWMAGIGPRLICRASHPAVRVGPSRGVVGPSALRPSSPSRPSALNRMTQSRTICRVTSPMCAASPAACHPRRSPPRPAGAGTGQRPCFTAPGSELRQHRNQHKGQ